MKITHFCNAFLGINEGQTCLACDPWVGPSNYGGWMSTPISSGGRTILEKLNPTHLYISHVHADHIGGLPIYEENILTTLTNTNITVLIKEFEHKALYNQLVEIGFNRIVELPGWETHQISQDLEITIIPTDQTNVEGLEDEINYDIDTSILIRSRVNNTYFYNNVDSPISLDGLRKVKEYVRSQNGEIDIACIGIGAASEYPQCFPKIDRRSEQNRIINSSLDKFGKQLSILENKLYFTAGGSYFIPGKFSPLNQYIAGPSFEQVASVVASSKTCMDIFDLSGGGGLEQVNGGWIRTEGKLHSFSNKEEEIRETSGLIYEYMKIPQDFDERSDEELFDLAKTNYFETLEKLFIDIKWKVEFHLYDELRLDDDARIEDGVVPLRTLILTKDASLKQPNELICHLDRQLFRALLNRICTWNITISGSIVIFERNPNVFIPTIPFSLNFLAVSDNERGLKGKPMAAVKQWLVETEA